jgi:hypothetical protein
VKKSECIAKYGKEAWRKQLAQSRAWQKAHREEDNARSKKYREEHPEEVRVDNQESYRKGGKRYNKTLEYKRTGIPGEKNRIRMKHARLYKPYKAIIAPDSQIHHEWVPETSDYRGVALVEANPHRYGIIDVIQIVDGEITLLTEEEIKKGVKRHG